MKESRCKESYALFGLEETLRWRCVACWLTYLWTGGGATVVCLCKREKGMVGNGSNVQCRVSHEQPSRRKEPYFIDRLVGV